MSAAKDVCEYLKTEDLVGGVTGWLLQRRRLPDTGGDLVVVVSEDGGVGPEISTSEGIGDSALEDPAVMVTVRANAWNGDASLAKADAILSALHGQRNVQLFPPSGDTYLAIRAQTPEPIFAGFDGQGRPLHTISFRMLRLVGV